MKAQSAVDSKEKERMSAALYPIGDELQAIWTEIESQGYCLSQLYRTAIREVAGSEATFQHVIRYWTEYAKERLAALVGPMDIRAGHIPAHTQYRSPYLDDLRSRQSPTAFEVERGAAAEIEPTLRAFLALYHTEEPKKTLGQHVSRRRALEAEQLIAANPYAMKMSFPTIYQAVVECFSKEFSHYGFVAEKPKSRGCVFRAPAGDGQWDFCYLDSSSEGVTCRQLSSALVLCERGRRLNPLAPSVNALAKLDIGDLVPGFHLYWHGNVGLCVRAHVAAAAAIWKRFDTQLRRHLHHAA
jgi:hypothetical protein